MRYYETNYSFWKSGTAEPSYLVCSPMSLRAHKMDTKSVILDSKEQFRIRCRTIYEAYKKGTSCHVNTPQCHVKALHVKSASADPDSDSDTDDGLAYV